MYRAAARLWTAGLAWKTALDIVTESFDAATYDPDATHDDVVFVSSFPCVNNVGK